MIFQSRLTAGMKEFFNNDAPWQSKSSYLFISFLARVAGTLLALRHLSWPIVSNVVPDTKQVPSTVGNSIKALRFGRKDILPPSIRQKGLEIPFR